MDPQPAGFGKIPNLPELAGHVLFETSGSSGKPKAVAISKQALLVSAAAVNRHLEVTPASRWGLALPVHHVGGFGVVARAYQAECGFQAFAPRWEVGAFKNWIDVFQISHTSLVPTQVHDLVRAGLSAPAGLRAIVVGGGFLDPLTGQAARDLGWPVLASYGMTEAGSQIATQPLELLDQPYQAAPIPLLPIWEAQVGADQILSISGPALFSGYVSEGEFHPRTPTGYLTSDRVTLLDRMLTPLGRVDTQVKILGELVDPEAVERELAAISEGVLALGTFAVIAVQDERAGCLLVPCFESSVPQSLIDSAIVIYQSNAPGFKRLQPAIFVKAMPRTDLGKLQRSRLLEIYRMPLMDHP